MSLAPCPSCSRHVRLTEAACPFCDTRFASVPAPGPRAAGGMSRAMLFFGGVVALSAAIEACGETPMPAPASLYGGPPVMEDAGATPPPPDPTPLPAPSASTAPSASGTASVEPPDPGAMVMMYGAPAPPLRTAPKADAGAHKPIAPAAAYGAPPSFLPPPKNGPTPKKP